MEIFKKINQNYEVSNLGRVKSLPRKHTNGGILKPYLLSNGYYRVTLCENSIPKAWSVHRLVAETYIPNPDRNSEVNHINGIKTDNRVENLEWCTRKSNSQHASQHNLYHPRKGENHPFSKLTQQQVKEIRSMYSTGNYTSLQLANKYNVTDGAIDAVINNKSWKDKSYVKYQKRHKLNKPEIREKFASGNYTQKQLSKEYNSSTSEIWRIIHNENV